MTIEDTKNKKIKVSPTDSTNTSGSQEICYESGSNSFESHESKNLIINYLPQYMNESEVHALFTTIGEVESCKLVRSKETKQSLGYAFVKYKNIDHAIEAVNKLNKITLGNKVIKVSYARPSKPEIKDANLYVGGLPSGCTADDLRNLFSKYGEIITCRVVQTEANNDYYFGFVRFDTKKQATEAMEALHGKVPCTQIIPKANNPLTVKFAKTPQPDCANFIQPQSYDYTWPRSPKISSDDFSKAYGRIHAQYISSISNKENEERNNHIYNHKVDYNTCGKLSSGCSCCAQLNGSNHSSSQGINVVLTNLPADVSELMLYRLCSKYGAINSVQVFFEENNWFAIIVMYSTEDAMNAVNCLNGLLLQPYSPIKAEIY